MFNRSNWRDLALFRRGPFDSTRSSINIRDDPELHKHLTTGYDFHNEVWYDSSELTLVADEKICLELYHYEMIHSHSFVLYHGFVPICAVAIDRALKRVVVSNLTTFFMNVVVMKDKTQVNVYSNSKTVRPLRTVIYEYDSDSIQGMFIVVHDLSSERIKKATTESTWEKSLSFLSVHKPSELWPCWCHEAIERPIPKPRVPHTSFLGMFRSPVLHLSTE